MGVRSAANEKQGGFMPSSYDLPAPGEWPKAACAVPSSLNSVSRCRVPGFAGKPIERLMKWKSNEEKREKRVWY
jgi:hypothetical protein